MADRDPETGIMLTHPMDGEMFTPMTPQVIELLERMRAEWKYWTVVAWKCNLRMKQLRNLRTGTRSAISLSLMDRMVTGTGVGHITEFEWYTPDQLVDMGIWKPVQHVAVFAGTTGDERVKAIRVPNSKSLDVSQSQEDPD